MTYIHVFGQGLLFLNTYEGAVELLEKRGAIYSDKPGLVMAGDLWVPSPSSFRQNALAHTETINRRCGCENMVRPTDYP